MAQQPVKLNLGHVLKAWRWKDDIGQREAAKILGVSASTLCRLESGEVRPDADTFVNLINWLMRPKS